MDNCLNVKITAIMDLDKATKIFQAHYKQWLNNENRNDNGYEYERSFAEQMQEMEKELFQESVGNVSGSRNLKKKSKPFSAK